MPVSSKGKWACRWIPSTNWRSASGCTFSANTSTRRRKASNHGEHISKDPNGRRTIQFVGSDGKRRSIRLGKVSQRQAEAVK